MQVAAGVIIGAVVIIVGEDGPESRGGAEDDYDNGRGDFPGNSEGALGEPSEDERGVSGVLEFKGIRWTEFNGVLGWGIAEVKSEDGPDEVGAWRAGLGSGALGSGGAENVVGAADDGVARFVVPGGGIQLECDFEDSFEAVGAEGDFATSSEDVEVEVGGIRIWMRLRVRIW
jgi:hypothetical protein